jgi:hydroxymethylbilane synthase
VDKSPIDGTRSVGVFTKRIQQALIDGVADVAVHSLKDLPTEPDDRFALAAVPPRETVADSLVSRDRFDLDTLPENAVVGTGSRRRTAQLLSRRPDLDVRHIRGNVQTRLRKLEAGEFDAILLAEAGVLRLEMHDLPRQVLPLSEMLPAPGQGALGIEVRVDDDASRAPLRSINDPVSLACVSAERIVLSRLHGGCLAPIAAHATWDSGRLTLRVCVLSPDGADRLDLSAGLDDLNSEEIDFQRVTDFAVRVSDELIDDGALAMIQAGRSA